jgi:predicted transcriptional regulator
MLICIYRRRTVAVEMTDFEEKVWKYLLSHPKTPVQAKTIAKEWIVSENRVARTLNRFVENGIADLVRIGTKKFYRVKE